MRRTIWNLFLPVFLIHACGAACLQAADSFTVERNVVLQWSLSAKRVHADPISVQLDAVLTAENGNTIRLPGYWAGGDEWRFRFSSVSLGDYTFVTECSDTQDEGLHGCKGSIRVVEYTGDNSLLRHGPIHLAPGKKYFEHADGQPFFWLADSWWHGMTTRLDWPGGFQTLTQDRREKGFSVIQFAVAFPCDIEPFDGRGANEAGHAWTEGFASINPAYFELVDLRIDWLVREGLVPNIVGAWGYYLPFMGVEKAEQHWRYLVARYGAYPVTWTICGESTLTWYLLEGEQKRQAERMQKEGWARVSKHIASIDPYSRLRTVHPGPASGRFEPLSDMGWIDVIMLQPGHHDSSVATAIEHRSQAVERYPGQPVMIGEACFEGMNGECKEKVQRMLFWGSVLSGAPGHSYGVDAIWQFNTRNQPFGKSPSGHVWGNSPWETAYQWPGSAHVGVGRRILHGYDWHQLKPLPNSLSPSADKLHPRDAFAAGIADRLRIIYLPNGVAPWNRKFIAKELASEAAYDATYIDPLTGESYEKVRFEPDQDGNWQLPAAPILQDWVIVIERVEP